MGTIKVKIISEIFKRIHSFTPRLNVIKKEILPTLSIHFKAERQQGE